MPPSTDGLGNGKRSRKPKTFTGYLTETNEAYFEEEDHANEVAHRVDPRKERQPPPQPPPPPAAAALQQPQAKRRKSTTSNAAANSTTRRQQQQASPSTAVSVKKVAGVQNATRKALEWLQYGDLSVLELTQSLPKLSKARVEIVMEALRAAGLVTLVRKHAPDATVSN